VLLFNVHVAFDDDTQMGKHSGKTSPNNRVVF